jgi:hypothetical protein
LGGTAWQIWQLRNQVIRLVIRYVCDVRRFRNAAPRVPDNRKSHPVNSLLVARVGFKVIKGEGWFRLVTMRANWPLGRLALHQHSAEISAFSFGLLPMQLNVPFEAMTKVRSTWGGLSIKYCIDAEQYEMVLSGLFLWSRLKACVDAHQLTIP